MMKNRIIARPMIQILVSHWQNDLETGQENCSISAIKENHQWHV